MSFGAEICVSVKRGLPYGKIGLLYAQKRPTDILAYLSSSSLARGLKRVFARPPCEDQPEVSVTVPVHIPNKRGREILFTRQNFCVFCPHWHRVDSRTFNKKKIVIAFTVASPRYVPFYIIHEPLLRY